MGNSLYMSMAIFYSYVSHYQRVSTRIFCKYKSPRWLSNGGGFVWNSSAPRKSLEFQPNFSYSYCKFGIYPVVSSNMVCWKIPELKEWRFQSENHRTKWSIFHCHVWLPDIILNFEIHPNPVLCHCFYQHWLAGCHFIFPWFISCSSIFHV